MESPLTLVAVTRGSSGSAYVPQEVPIMRTQQESDHEGAAAGSDPPAASYRLPAGTIRPETALGQALLEEAYLKHDRPRCPCQPTGVPMYIAKVGARYLVKRMPDTGAQHALECGSYAPEDVSGVGQLLGGAVRVDPDSGQAVLRLGFRLSVGERAAPEGGGAADAHDSVTGSPKRLSLRELLDYLWHEADLVAWSPGMTGRRHWGLIAALLGQTAGAARAKGHPLTERLYVPEPFRLDRKAEIAARRLNAWQRAVARRGQTQQLMVLIAEVKAIEPARFGHKLVLKHLPDAPLFLAEDLHRKLTRRFADELDLWAAEEQGHLVAIATFTVGRGGSATAEEVALMPTTAQWLPYPDPYAKVLVQALVDQGRRFRTVPRFSCPSSVDLPVVVLTDCEEPQPLRVCVDSSSTDLEEPFLAGWEWTWHVAAAMPSLPAARR